MTTIYIVQGKTGLDDDKREWLVKAFASEFVAIDYRDSAQRRAMEIIETIQALSYPKYDEIYHTDTGKLAMYRAGLDRYHQSIRMLRTSNQYDPQMQECDGYVEYDIVEVEYVS